MATEFNAISHGAEAQASGRVRWSFWDDFSTCCFFLMAAPVTFPSKHRHCGFSRRAFGFDRGSLSGVWPWRRPEHLLGYRAKLGAWPLCSSGSGNPHDAQVGRCRIR